MLIVRLYSDIPSGLKPAGIPDAWPAEVRDIDNAAPIPSGFTAMSSAELEAHKATHLSAYQAWRDVEELPSIKAARFEDIDAKTTSLIEAGFAYGGKIFSLSINAQSTYSGLYMIREEPALSFPVAINTIDDLDTHPLADAQEIRAFYLTAVATYRGHLDAGTALKNAVREASTAAEVAAIQDNR